MVEVDGSKRYERLRRKVNTSYHSPMPLIRSSFSFFRSIPISLHVGSFLATHFTKHICMSMSVSIPLHLCLCLSHAVHSLFALSLFSFPVLSLLELLHLILSFFTRSLYRYNSLHLYTCPCLFVCLSLQSFHLSFCASICRFASYLGSLCEGIVIVHTQIVSVPDDGNSAGSSHSTGGQRARQAAGQSFRART